MIEGIEISMSLESKFQAKLIIKLKRMFPNCLVLKNDPNYLQGIPDLTILWYGRWAVLEVKGGADEPYQPNQEYYVDRLNRMGFARFIFPENEEEVLRELQQALES
jgi:hypothetical protein